MCGIVAAVAARNVVPVLIEGLQRLEYRGYDSAGLALLNPALTRLRSVGRVAELATQAAGQTAHLGIAHTRWATHGVPSERNAHPHISGGLAVVHNGIIENYAVLREELIAAGYAFTSDTDTEVIAHLIQQTLKFLVLPVECKETLVSPRAFFHRIRPRRIFDFNLGVRNGNKSFGDITCHHHDRFPLFDSALYPFFCLV